MSIDKRELGYSFMKWYGEYHENYLYRMMQESETAQVYKYLNDEWFLSDAEKKVKYIDEYEDQDYIQAVSIYVTKLYSFIQDSLDPIYINLIATLGKGNIKLAICYAMYFFFNETKYKMNQLETKLFYMVIKMTEESERDLLKNSKFFLGKNLDDMQDALVETYLKINVQ